MSGASDSTAFFDYTYSDGDATLVTGDTFPNYPKINEPGLYLIFGRFRPGTEDDFTWVASSLRVIDDGGDNWQEIPGSVGLEGGYAFPGYSSIFAYVEPPTANPNSNRMLIQMAYSAPVSKASFGVSSYLTVVKIG